MRNRILRNKPHQINCVFTRMTWVSIAVVEEGELLAVLSRFCRGKSDRSQYVDVLIQESHHINAVAVIDVV